MDKLRPGNDFDKRSGGTSEVALRVWLGFIAILGATFVPGCILYVWLYIQQVQNGYHLAKYHEEHEQLLAVQRKLRLEWTRYQDPIQLEEMGRNQFGLAPPRQDQKVLMR